MGKLKKFLKKQLKGKASNTRKKRQRNNRKKRQRNNRKKATAEKWDGSSNSENVCKQPPPKSVSEDYLAAFSAKTMAAMGVTFINSQSYYKPPYTAGADPKNIDAIMKSKKDYELPSPEPVFKDFLAAFSAKTMAALGVTFTNSQAYYKPPYTGSLVLNSGADPKNGDAIMKSKKDYELPSPEPVSEDYLAAFSAKTMAAMGVTFTNSQAYYKPPYPF